MKELDWIGLVSWSDPIRFDSIRKGKGMRSETQRGVSSSQVMGLDEEKETNNKQQQQQ